MGKINIVVPGLNVKVKYEEWCLLLLESAITSPNSPLTAYNTAKAGVLLEDNHKEPYKINIGNINFVT